MSDRRTPGRWCVAEAPFPPTLVWAEQGEPGVVINVANFLNVRDAALAALAPDLLSACDALLHEFDKLTRYGSPMAKNANEAVRFARDVVAKAVYA